MVNRKLKIEKIRKIKHLLHHHAALHLLSRKHSQRSRQRLVNENSLPVSPPSNNPKHQLLACLMFKSPISSSVYCLIIFCQIINVNSVYSLNEPVTSGEGLEGRVKERRREETLLKSSEPRHKITKHSPSLTNTPELIYKNPNKTQRRHFIILYFKQYIYLPQRSCY